MYHLTLSANDEEGDRHIRSTIDIDDLSKADDTINERYDSSILKDIDPVVAIGQCLQYYFYSICKYMFSVHNTQQRRHLTASILFKRWRSTQFNVNIFVTSPSNLIICLGCCSAILQFIVILSLPFFGDFRFFGLTVSTRLC